MANGIGQGFIQSSVQSLYNNGFSAIGSLKLETEPTTFAYSASSNDGVPKAEFERNISASDMKITKHPLTTVVHQTFATHELHKKNHHQNYIHTDNNGKKHPHTLIASGKKPKNFLFDVDFHGLVDTARKHNASSLIISVDHNMLQYLRCKKNLQLREMHRRYIIVIIVISLLVVAMATLLFVCYFKGRNNSHVTTPEISK